MKGGSRETEVCSSWLFCLELSMKGWCPQPQCQADDFTVLGRDVDLVTSRNNEGMGLLPNPKGVSQAMFKDDDGETRSTN